MMPGPMRVCAQLFDLHPELVDTMICGVCGKPASRARLVTDRSGMMWREGECAEHHAARAWGERDPHEEPSGLVCLIGILLFLPVLVLLAFSAVYERARRWGA